MPVNLQLGRDFPDSEKLFLNGFHRTIPSVLLWVGWPTVLPLGCAARCRARQGHSPDCQLQLGITL
jgi:hypothetical protein